MLLSLFRFFDLFHPHDIAIYFRATFGADRFLDRSIENEGVINELVKCGLVRPRSDSPSLEEVLQSLVIGDLRKLIRLSNGSFNSNTKALLLSFLRSMMNEQIEQEARRMAKLPTLEYVVPTSMTWEELQSAHFDYKGMLFYLYDWLIDGYAPPTARSFFQKLC